MSIEKMVLVKIVGSMEEMPAIIKELIIHENVHLNLNIEHSNAYSNYYVIHQYESDIVSSHLLDMDPKIFIQRCTDCLDAVKELGKGLDIELKVDNKIFLDSNINFSLEKSKTELTKIKSSIGVKVNKINNYRQQIEELSIFSDNIECISDKTVDLNKVADLNYFDYEIGTLSNENKIRIKRNYENLSAIVLRIGIIKSSVEDMYMIIYPKQFKEETNNLLKSLNWDKLNVPDGIVGTPSEMIVQINQRIETLQEKIKELSNEIEGDKELNTKILNKLFNIFTLEEKIAEISENAEFGDNIFAINLWIQEKDLNKLKDSISSVSNKYLLTEKTAEEMGNQVVPPTKLKNNWFTKPFETIVRMYGLPAYNELDPTPFLAITFCLAFGIMFGDIGQGLVYFLAGVLLLKKMESAGQILMRLGGSSILFGFVYGSLFGLEKHELPWLPSLIKGGPLSPDNIPKILVAGILFGIAVLSVSYVYGVINSLKNGNIEEGIFGKNGITGYIFFISFILTIVTLIGIINLPLSIPLIVLLLSLVILIMKEPITNIILKKKPLFHDGAGSYLTESIFEAVETILGVLSNSISFVRVGAFALNHAGLFLAFLVISEMVTNPFMKVLILIIGNILILTLEGLIVFIQGLRLQYYELFSKYFKGDGIEFKPLNVNK